jgi:sensor histidine kinase YesM
MGMVLIVKRIWNAWLGAPLNKKIAVIFLSITVLSSLTVGLVSNELSMNVITNSSIEESRNAAKAVAVTIESFFRAADTTFIGVYSNKELGEALKAAGTAGEDSENLRQNIQSAVYSARQVNTSVQYINIYGKNGFSYTDFYYHDQTNRSYEECVAYYSRYGLTEDRRAALWIPNQTTVVANASKRMITLVRYIRDVYTFKIQGIMTMGVAETTLATLYQSVNNNMYIVEKNGTIISQYDKTLLGKVLPYPELTGALSSGADTGTLSFNDKNGSKLFATYTVIPATGWYIVSIADHYRAFMSSYNLSYYIVIILLMTIFVSSAVLVKASKVLTASLNRLFATMKQAMSGDLSARFKSKQKDEVSQIGTYLNEMLKDIGESIRYREESERLARLSELRLLQSQINPHLLYNTLDSVHYHLETGKYDSATDILQAMSAFFKLSLSQGDFLIPIDREISLIQNYLDIQRMCRYKDIELIISGDTSLLSLKIPKMTLQPIVENAILHGFEGDIVRGTVTIDLTRSEDTAVITATDNGTGITEDQVEKINASIQAPHAGFEQKHYGLWNINQRLKDAFGTESGIEIQSEFGVYTRAIITLCRVNLPDEKDQGGTTCTTS